MEDLDLHEGVFDTSNLVLWLVAAHEEALEGLDERLDVASELFGVRRVYNQDLLDKSDCAHEESVVVLLKDKVVEGVREVVDGIGNDLENPDGCHDGFLLDKVGLVRPHNVFDLRVKLTAHFLRGNFSNGGKTERHNEVVVLVVEILLNGVGDHHEDVVAL